MKRIVGVICALAIAVGATTANAAGQWYWTRGAAEHYLKDSYYDVLRVHCVGWGTPYRGSHYRKFKCSAKTIDSEILYFHMRVTSKNGARIY